MSEREVVMEQESYIGYGSQGYTLVNQQGQEVVTLAAGDRLELFISTTWQWVRVESGGYKGWYYVTADGRPARFAIAMHTRGYQAARCSVAEAPTESVPEQVSVQPQRMVHGGKRVRGVKRGMVVESVETLPSGVLLLHLTKRADNRKEQPA